MLDAGTPMRSSWALQPSTRAATTSAFHIVETMTILSSPLSGAQRSSSILLSPCVKRVPIGGCGEASGSGPWR